MAAQSQELTLREKTDQVIATLELPGVLAQIEEQLPEGVTLKRFVGVAKTAIRANADLVKADQTSLFASIIKCAQDGLLPDGRQAALVIYGGKVSYLRMVDGIRAIAATYGWQIRTSVVYAEDEFDYTDEPPVITHRPVRPGLERGELIAAYAVAQHRDGRRMQTVLHPADIAKRRAKAQTQAVWNEWTPQMYEKTAAHDIFKQLSLDPADARVDRILREGILADPIAALYGNSLRAGPEPTTDDAASGKEAKEAVQASGPVDGAKPEEAAEALPAAASVPPADQEEEAVWTVAPTDEEVELAGAIKVPKGVHKDKTLAQVAEEDGAATWFLTQLKNIPDDQPVKESFAVFVQARLPEVWERYGQHLAEQTS